MLRPPGEEQDAGVASRGSSMPPLPRPSSPTWARALAQLRARSWFGPGARLPLVLFRLGLGSIVGRRVMVLTTTGRRSGRPRHSMVYYAAAGDVLYAAAVYGPASDWYRNLLAQPLVTVQTHRGAETRRTRLASASDPVPASIRVVSGTVPVMAFERASGSGPVPLEADLRWLLGPAVAALALAFLRRVLSGVRKRTAEEAGDEGAGDGGDEVRGDR